MRKNRDLSIIIPLKDEEESLEKLYKELTSILIKLRRKYELIFIDDGSTDGSFAILQKLSKKDRSVKIIKLRGNFGKSNALSIGFDKAINPIIITIDADLQDDPKEIPKLIATLESGYDLVSGWRKRRNDSITKRISSLLFNRGTSLISGVPIHDFNCGLKVMRKEVVDEIFLHGELHRFIPVLAAKLKFKVGEVAVNHRMRKYGSSKYGNGLSRSWKGMLDLLTAIFVTDYSSKPAHFFGKIGIIFFLIGFVLDGYVTLLKIFTGSTQDKIPLLLAGILFILLGVQLLSTGLIAEMISYFIGQRKK